MTAQANISPLEIAALRDLLAAADPEQLALWLPQLTPAAPIAPSLGAPAPARLELRDLTPRHSPLWHLLRPHAQARRNGGSNQALLLCADLVRELARKIAGEPKTPAALGAEAPARKFRWRGRWYWLVSALSWDPGLPVPPGCQGQVAIAAGKCRDAAGRDFVGYWYVKTRKGKVVEPELGQAWRIVFSG